jgi:hypothetical protein
VYSNFYVFRHQTRRLLRHTKSLLSRNLRSVYTAWRLRNDVFSCHLWRGDDDHYHNGSRSTRKRDKRKWREASGESPSTFTDAERWSCSRTGQTQVLNLCRVLVGKPDGKRQLGRLGIDESIMLNRIWKKKWKWQSRYHWRSVGQSVSTSLCRVLCGAPSLTRGRVILTRFIWLSKRTSVGCRAKVNEIWLSRFWIYPSSCLSFKTRRFGDWILSLFSGGTYSVPPSRKRRFHLKWRQNSVSETSSFK